MLGWNTGAGWTTSCGLFEHSPAAPDVQLCRAATLPLLQVPPALLNLARTCTAAICRLHHNTKCRCSSV